MLQLGNKITVGEPIYKFQNNHSVDFDGVDDFIQLGEPISYTQHTISTWVKFTNETYSRVIFDARDSSEDGITIFVTSLEKITYRIGDGSGSELTSDSLTINEWHHIVATYDGTTQKLYINGALDQSATTSKEIDTTTNAKIGIVAYIDAAAFLGKIDELAIWDRALTAAEVTEIYRIKYGANLVQNGRFDELGSELIPQPVNLLNSPIVANGGGVINSSSEFETFGGTLDGIRTNNLLTEGKTYKLIIEGSTTSSGFTVGNTSGSGGQYGTGFGTFYFVASGSSATAAQRIWIRQATAGVTTITNFSVKQVDPNDRWTLGTGWAYGDSKVLRTAQSGSTACDQNLSLTAGNTYKISYVLDITAGSFLARLAGTTNVNGATRTTSGAYTDNLVAVTGNNKLRLVGTDGTFAGSVTNVMVEEQKYVATNLKLNSGNYKSADPVIVSTKSVDFDGTDDYLEVTKKDFLGTSDFTISLWIRPDTVSANNYIIGQSTDDNTRWYIRVNTLANVQMFRKSGGTTFNLQGGAVVLNKWNHIVITEDRDGSAIAYLNGVQVQSASGNSHDLTTTGNLRIGSFELFGAYFDGTIDDVGIFNTALTSDQVIELYNQGVPSNLSTHSANANLTGYWKMGDGTLDEAPLIADQTNATLGSELITNGDFATDSGWSFYNADADTNTRFENNSAILEVLNTQFTRFISTTSPMTLDKFYKITYEVTETDNTDLNIQYPNTSLNSSIGTHTIYIKATNVNIGFSKNNVGKITIDNVSVKQVNGNPALMQNTPTIVTDAPLTKIRNYYRMGDGLLDKHQADNNSTGITLFSTRGLICDMIEPSLGTELITDGDFPAGTSAWDLGTGWELETGACVRSGHGSNTDFRQSISITANKVYQISYTRIYVSGTRTTNLFSDFETDGSNITLGDYRGTEETFTVVSFFMPTYTGSVLIRIFGINDWTGSITNVSVKEVNGVGGFMTNMINTDITNDVPS
jgi:hypothetical protein